MKEKHRHPEANYAKLHSAYRAEWWSLSEQVSRWRLLVQEAQPDAISISAAEAEIRLAEERYRKARNGLAEYMLEQRFGKLKDNQQTRKDAYPGQWSHLAWLLGADRNHSHSGQFKASSLRGAGSHK